MEYTFSDIINENFLFQHVTVQTFQLLNAVAMNTLDLIFTS